MSFELLSDRCWQNKSPGQFVNVPATRWQSRETSRTSHCHCVPFWGISCSQTLCCIFLKFRQVSNSSVLHPLALSLAMPRSQNVIWLTGSSSKTQRTQTGESQVGFCSPKLLKEMRRNSGASKRRPLLASSTKWNPSYRQQSRFFSVCIHPPGIHFCCHLMQTYQMCNEPQEQHLMGLVPAGFPLLSETFPPFQITEKMSLENCLEIDNGWATPENREMKKKIQFFFRK